MGRIVVRARRLVVDEGAQSLVEFALLLPLLMYILMGIVQFGLVFNAYITLSNAVREGAREASFYVYDNTLSQTANDTERLKKLVNTMVSARGVLNMGTAYNVGTTNFAHTGTWSATCTYTTSPCTVTDQDIKVTYTLPGDVTANEPRRGYQFAVEASYHEAIFVPLLDQFLPNDPLKGAGWFQVPGRITVVIN